MDMNLRLNQGEEVQMKEGMEVVEEQDIVER